MTSSERERGRVRPAAWRIYHIMSTNFSEDGEQLDQDLEDLRDRIERVENTPNSGDGGTGQIASTWGSIDHYGPETPRGSHHRSPVGITIDPDEPVLLQSATVDADSDGTLHIGVHPLIPGDGGLGYPDSPMEEFRFDVSSGRNTLEFNVELGPLPDAFAGYSFSIDDSEVQLRRDNSVSMPQDLGPVEVSAWSSSSGSDFNGYYHFFNLELGTDRTERPIHSYRGRTSVDFEKSNGQYHIKPPIRDLGVAVNEVIDEASAGSVISLPQGSVFSDSTIFVDKPLGIIGQGANTDLRDPAGLRIIPTGDHPVIECEDGVGLRTGGYHIVGENVRTGPGVVVHGRSVISNITGDDLNDDLVHLHQGSHEDNLNSSRVWGVAGRSIDGSVVHLSKTTSAKRELNAVSIDVRMSFSCDYGINADDGFGNYYYIQQTEGTHETALRMNTQRSLGWVQYAEGGTKPVIELLDGQNVGVIIHAGGSTSYEDLWNLEEAAGNNWFIQLTRHQDPYFHQNWSNMDVKGDFQIKDGDLVMENENGETFEYRPDGDGDLVRDT